MSSLNWSVVEVGTGIICASIPSLKPLLIRVFPGKLFTLPRGGSRLPQRSGPSVSQATERDSYGLEMGSYLQGSRSVQKTGVGSATQVLRSISTKPISTRRSGEERLVSAGSRNTSRGYRDANIYRENEAGEMRYVVPAQLGGEQLRAKS